MLRRWKITKGRCDMKYRVREGSIVDYARGIALCAGFVCVLFWAIVTTYPM